MVIRSVRAGASDSIARREVIEMRQVLIARQLCVEDTGKQLDDCCESDPSPPLVDVSHRVSPMSPRLPETCIYK